LKLGPIPASAAEAEEELYVTAATSAAQESKSIDFMKPVVTLTALEWK
jgi:hypothetical protein